ncbi:MAG: addiction module protein [Rhodoplanes sp.]
MTTKLRNIEIEAETADAFDARAAERGLSVGELVADLVARAEALRTVPADQIAELDRRWAKVMAGEPTVPKEKVVRWLQTWGTPAFRPWHDQ